MGVSGMPAGAPAVEDAQADGADVLTADGSQAAVGAALAQRQAAQTDVGGAAAFHDVPDAGVEYDHGIGWTRFPIHVGFTSLCSSAMIRFSCGAYLEKR